MACVIHLLFKLSRSVQLLNIYHLSSTLMQFLFSFDQDMRFEKTLIQTLASQLSYKLSLLNSHQLLFWFDQDMRFEKLSYKLSLLNSHQLLFSFDQDMGVEKTLIQTLAYEHPLTLSFRTTVIWFKIARFSQFL